MKKLKSKYKIQYLKYLILSLFILPATIVLAQLTMPDFGTPFDLNGWTINTVDTGTVLLDNSVRKIDAHGICKNVQATDGKQYFVPTKSPSEWNSFIDGAPNGINISACTPQCNSITWTKTNFPPNSWEQVDISSDGQTIVAIDINSTVYISKNGGLSYTTQTVGSGLGAWENIAVSANGQIILKHSQQDYVYISRDFGNTWQTITTLGKPDRVSFSISNDGTKMAIAELYNNFVYLSNDSGNTWIQQTSIGQHNWGDVAIVESNPNIIYAAYFESNTLAVYKTQDFGQNWNLILTKSINDPSSLNYADLSVSKSGQYILVNHSILSTNPQIFFSNNYGLSWQNIYMPSYSIDNNTQIKEYHDAIVHDSGVFCIRRTGGDFTISKPPVCSFDEGSTFVEQTSATGTNMGYLLVGSRGFNAKNNIFVLSGMLGWFSTTGGYVYIGTCNP